jgi:hypothetical protein
MPNLNGPFNYAADVLRVFCMILLLCYIVLRNKVTNFPLIEDVSSYKIPKAVILNDAVISATSNRYDK